MIAEKQREGLNLSAVFGTAVEITRVSDMAQVVGPEAREEERIIRIARGAFQEWPLIASAIIHWPGGQGGLNVGRLAEMGEELLLLRETERVAGGESITLPVLGGEINLITTPFFPEDIQLSRRNVALSLISLTVATEQWQLVAENGLLVVKRDDTSEEWQAEVLLLPARKIGEIIKAVGITSLAFGEPDLGVAIVPAMVPGLRTLEKQERRRLLRDFWEGCAGLTPVVLAVDETMSFSKTS